MEKWLEKEVALNQKHEEILSQREILLHQEELNLEGDQDFQSSVAHHWQQAKARNKALLKDIKICQAVFKEQLAVPQPSGLVTLKEQYWNFVLKELPEWKAEVKSQSKNSYR